MNRKHKFSRTYSPSADVIGSNEYFLSQILPHLPVKPLIRSKCVSKLWLALISDPKFGLRHTCEHPNSRIPYGLFFYNPLLRDLYYSNHFSTDQVVNEWASLSKFKVSPSYSDDSVYSVSLSKFGFGGKMPSCSDPEDIVIKTTIELLPGKNMMKMVQSCNGLNLFQFNTSHQHLKLYCVRNLATHQLKLVPLPELDGDDRIVTCNLAFDPLVSPHYKIICIKEGKLIGSRTLIYTSESSQWKDTHVPIDGWLVEFAKGVYFQGAIYWVGNDFSSGYCCRFDVEAEKFTKISMPASLRGAILYFKYFGEFNGHLHLVCSPNSSPKIFNIFELDQVTMKWFVKYRVHINRLKSPFPEIVVKGVFNDSQYAFSILCVVRGAKEEDSSLVMAIHGKVVSYNFMSKRVEVLSELPLLKHYMNFDGSNAYTFVPTLYPL